MNHNARARVEGGVQVNLDTTILKVEVRAMKVEVPAIKVEVSAPCRAEEGCN